MKPFFRVFLLVAAACTALAQTPAINYVENSATNVPAGLPNSGIAQGSLFVVKGKNLGPAAVIVANSFPLQTTLGGTSVTVTVSGTTVNAIMYYSLASQVAAILPSSTPVGDGTLTVTYNGGSATAPIEVVQNNIGIFTVSQSGTGDAIAFLNADNGLITPTHAANPSDVIVFWGTGLGPVTSDETQPAVQTNMTDIPLQVYIGGQQADIVFQGRNACCSSVDTVYVTVPLGVSGCAVAVNMIIGDMVANTTTIAIADSGRTCTPVNPNLSVSGTGTYTYGGFSLERVVQSQTIGGITTTAKNDAVGGSFLQVTYSGAYVQGSQMDINSYGSCTVATQIAGQSVPQTPLSTVHYLDAGASIALSAPFGNRNVARTASGGYESILDQSASTLTAGTYTFMGSGGADVGPFTGTFPLPALFVWTNQSSVKTVSRSDGVTVNWSGGDPSGYVTVSGQSIAYGSTSANSVIVSFTCTARASDGSFTVPPSILMALPASAAAPGSQTLTLGGLAVSGTSAPQSFPAPPGIQYASLSTLFAYSGSVTYQ